DSLQDCQEKVLSLEACDYEIRNTKHLTGSIDALREAHHAATKVYVSARAATFKAPKEFRAPLLGYVHYLGSVLEKAALGPRAGGDAASQEEVGVKLAYACHAAFDEWVAQVEAEQEQILSRHIKPAASGKALPPS